MLGNLLRVLTLALVFLLPLSAPSHAAQSTCVTPGSPLTMTQLKSFLDNCAITIGSNYAGVAAPGVFTGGAATTYQFWLDTSSTPKVLRINDGANWVQIGTLDTVAHSFSIAVSQVPTSSSSAAPAIIDANKGAALYFSNASAAVTIGQAGGGGNFLSGWFADLKYTGSGTMTLTPTTSTIDGAASKTFTPGQSCRLVSDGSNYVSLCGPGTPTTAVGGVVFSKAAVASNWLRSLGTDGIFTASQPAFTDILGSLACAQRAALVGDVTTPAGSCTTTVVNLPTGTTMAGSLLATNIVAPGTPAAGKTSIYVDSTDKRLHDKNDAGTIGTTVVADTGTANNYISAISAAGVITKSRPACATLSDAAASCATDATNAANIGSGTLPTGRISGSYTGITAVGTIGTGVWQGTAVALGFGGTGQATALAARGSSGLNIDGATSTGDANYTILPADRLVYHTALSAARTDTLPAANAVNVGQVFYVADFRGVATVANTVTLQRAGADTINGGTSVLAISAAYGAGLFWSDGVSRWTFLPAGAAGSGTVTQVSAGNGMAFSNITGSGSVVMQQVEPGGRLTLTTGTPVMTATATGQTSLFYAPYRNPFVPVYDGTRMQLQQFTSSTTDVTGLTITLGSNWAANSNFDAFVGVDSGTVRACTGPAWTSDSARGTGAGTTELQMFNGVMTNKVSMTCRYNNTTTFTCAVNQCTYVGTARTNGSTGQVDFNLGGTAAGGTAGVIGIWNMYNRVMWSALVADSTDNWNYTTTSFRASDNSNSMRISFVAGFNEDIVSGLFAGASLTTTNACKTGIGYDSTTVASGTYQLWAFTSIGPSFAMYNPLSGLGYHYLQALEFGNTGCTFYGDNGAGTVVQTGLTATGKY